MAPTTDPKALQRPIERFLKRNAQVGAALLRVFAGEARAGGLDRASFVDDDGKPEVCLVLNQLVRAACADAARRDPEDPLDQRRVRGEYWKLFQDLERARWGRTVVGRRGQPTRFVFRVAGPGDLVERALGALGVESGAPKELQVESRSSAPETSAEKPPGELGHAGAPGREEVVSLLKAHAGDLRRLGVDALSLFGSVARDEAGAESDVDLVAQFREPVTSERFFDTKFFLEDLLRRRVDLVTFAALGERLKKAIEPELIRVA
jgi:predicted nucleotidyltransferase